MESTAFSAIQPALRVSRRDDKKTPQHQAEKSIAEANRRSSGLTRAQYPVRFAERAVLHEFIGQPLGQRIGG